LNKYYSELLDLNKVELHAANAHNGHLDAPVQELVKTGTQKVEFVGLLLCPPRATWGETLLHSLQFLPSAAAGLSRQAN
jgi:hypothetical protein